MREALSFIGNSPRVSNLWRYANSFYSTELVRCLPICRRERGVGRLFSAVQDSFEDVEIAPDASVFSSREGIAIPCGPSHSALDPDHIFFLLF